MVCDDCVKKDVCKSQSKFYTLEKDIDQCNSLDCAEIQIKCKFKVTNERIEQLKNLENEIFMNAIEEQRR